MELRCHSCDGTYDCSWKSVGFSISTMKADQTLFQRLNAPTKAPHWPVGSSGNRPPSKIPIPLPPFRSTKSVESLSRPLQLSEQGHILETAIEAGVNAVIGMRDSLNDWDSKVGDGDCGPTLRCNSFFLHYHFCSDLLVYPLNDAIETVNEIGSSVRRAMRGTSGVFFLFSA
ncbi:hypothetical protein V6N13_108480 [Hibiscus sabdariffa]